MECIFMEGKSDYRLLQQIESIAFRRICKHSEYWEALFQDARIKFEAALEHCEVEPEESETLFLLYELFCVYPTQ